MGIKEIIRRQKHRMQNRTVIRLFDQKEFSNAYECEKDPDTKVKAGTIDTHCCGRVKKPRFKYKSLEEMCEEIELTDEEMKAVHDALEYDSFPGYPDMVGDKYVSNVVYLKRPKLNSEQKIILEQLKLGNSIDIDDKPKKKFFKGWYKFVGSTFADIAHKYENKLNHYLFTVKLDDGFGICYKAVEGFEEHMEFIEELLSKPQAPNADMVGISDTIRIEKSDINFDLLQYFKRISTHRTWLKNTNY